MGFAVTLGHAEVSFLLGGELALYRGAVFVAKRFQIGGHGVGDVAENAFRFHRVVISVFGEVHFVAVIENLTLHRARIRLLIVYVNLNALLPSS